MTKGRLIHIYIRPKASISLEDIEAKLNKALDWFRYGSGLYILFTTTEITIWKARLLPLVKDDGSLFIFPMDEGEHYGWMNPKFWTWLKEKREKIEQKRSSGDQS